MADDLDNWYRNTAFRRRLNASPDRPGEGRSPMMSRSEENFYNAPEDTEIKEKSPDRPGEGRSPMMGKPTKRQFRRSSPSEADRLMDIYNKRGGASDEDIASAYRSINPTMKKGGKVSPKKPTAPKAVKYARGGGIESRGKTRGKFV